MVWLVSATYLMYVTTFYGYIFWAPDFVHDTLQVSPLVTGLVTGLIACLTAVAALASGASSDRTGDRFRPMLAGLALTTLGYLAAALMPTAIGRVAGLAVSVGNMTFAVCSGACPACSCAGVRRQPPSRS
jgi:nitrate/nitrite transporter NarK